MHHNLHKTNYILSKFLLFSPKQVNITSETTGPGLIPEARRGNYPNDRPSCPPTIDPGLIPETRRETLSEQSPKLSSDNRHWINTRSTTGKLSIFCQLLSPQSNQY